ncbi:MAG: heparinase II/III family protein [Planctomycetes bacterium]|nr:heparinase II/III family protein [Planctomycetota bacterium]
MSATLSTEESVVTSRIARPDPAPKPPELTEPIRLTPAAFERPRMLFTGAELTSLKARLDGKIEKAMLGRLTQRCEKLIATFQPPAPGTPISDRGPSAWPPYLALAYLLTGEKRYLEKAKAWTLAIARQDHKFHQQRDLPVSHALACVAWVYDMLHAEWTASERAEIKQFVLDLGSHFFNITAAPTCYWGSILLQNHCQVAWTALGAIGMAFHDELAPAKEWAQWVQRVYRTISWLQPQDGTNLEGCSYGTYGSERRVLHYEAAKRCLGENLYAHGEKEMGRWIQHLTLPEFKAKHNAFNWGDNPPRFDTHGPVHSMLACAKAFRDPQVQGLALEFWRREIGGDCALTWLDLLLYDPSVPEGDWRAEPTSKHFSDWDLVQARSGWDANATALSYRCGPFQGHRLMNWNSGDLGGAHMHGDNNSIMLFSRGEFLLCDPGYEFRKRTDHHNTVLVDGFGQLGEGMKWYNVNRVLHEDGYGEVLSFADDGQTVSWVGECGRDYVIEAKLKSFRRHVLYARPDLLVVADELEAAEPREFTQLWHSPTPIVAQNGGKNWGFTQGRAALSVLPVLNADPAGAATVLARRQELADLTEKGKSQEELRVTSGRALKWRFVTVLCAGAAEAGPVRLEAQVAWPVVKVKLGSGETLSVRFSPDDGAAPRLE